MYRQWMARAGVVALALVLLAAAACNDDDDDPGLGGTPTPLAETTPDPTPEPPPDDDDGAAAEPEDTPEPADDTNDEPAEPGNGETVDSPIEGSQFESHTISAGDTVRWENMDSVPHTVTADDGEFDSGNLDQGDTFEHQFDSAGEFSFFCEVHPTMTATITVE